jgi:hypothetical protein
VEGRARRLCVHRKGVEAPERLDFETAEQGRPDIERIPEDDGETEILRAAAEWKADLLVLGSHGRRGISRLILGSTAAAVLRGASCNALVIPAALAAAGSLNVTRLDTGSRAQIERLMPFVSVQEIGESIQQVRTE